MDAGKIFHSNVYGFGLLSMLSYVGDVLTVCEYPTSVQRSERETLSSFFYLLL
jgi:hypothetical protein